MHPLLSPSTHADLKILSQQLTNSGYYPDSEQAYLKMFMGLTLGMTALESLKGITVEGDLVIVEHFQLIERAVKRAGYKVEVVVNDKVCEATVLCNGRLIGKAEYPADRNAAGRSFRAAYVGACREYLTDVFGHRFKMRDEMPSKAETIAEQVASATGVAVTTADTAPPPKAKATTVIDTGGNEYLSTLSVTNRNALLKWQNEIDQLDPENSGSWDAHRYRLGDMKFLGEAELIDLLERFITHAKTVGMGYREADRRFFVLANQTSQKQEV